MTELPDTDTQTAEESRGLFNGQLPLIIGLMIGVLAVAFELYAISTAMPVIDADLHFGPLYAWPGTMFLIGQVFATVVAGRLCDTVGAFRPLAGGMVLFIGGLVLAGASNITWTLLAARFIQGLGGGCLNLALMVVVAEVFTGRQRSTLMAIFSACYLAPAFLGPVAAAWIAKTFSWHWVFWSLIPLLLLTCAMGGRPLWRFYRDRVPKPADEHSVPIYAAGLAAAGVVLLQLCSQSFEDVENIRRQVVINAIIYGLVGLAVLAYTLPKIMPPGIFKLRKGLPAVMGVRATLAGAFFAAEFFLPKMMTEVRGISLELAGLSLALGAGGWFLGSFLQSQSWLKIRRDQIIQLGSGLSTVGLVLVGWFAYWSQASYVIVAAGLLLAGLGMGLAITSTSLAVMNLSPAELYGRNTSSLQVSDSLGSAFFGGLSGSMMAALLGPFGTDHTFGIIYLTLAAVAALSLVLGYRVGHIRNESVSH
jgi:MFS family permease